MNRFLLFAGSYYYPSGGWNDFVQSFESLESAKDYIITNVSGYDWIQIVDSKTEEIVFSKV